MFGHMGVVCHLLLDLLGVVEARLVLVAFVLGKHSDIINLCQGGLSTQIYKRSYQGI